MSWILFNVTYNELFKYVLRFALSFILTKLQAFWKKKKNKKKKIMLPISNFSSILQGKSGRQSTLGTERPHG